MKKLITAFLITLVIHTFASCNDVAEVVDTYDFRMVLKVPRIYDNTCSLGYRKYQTQTIKGEMIVRYKANEDYPIISITNLVNKTHKINGKNITYSCTVDDGNYVLPRWNVIGDNKKNTFNTPSVCFYLDAEPSYNLGEDEPDNSLLVTIAGGGSTATKTHYSEIPYQAKESYKEYDPVKRKYVTKYHYVTKYKKVADGKFRVISHLSGYVAGTLGCGCTAYGHKSPTRVMGAYCASETVDDVAAVDGTWYATIKGRVEK